MINIRTIIYFFMFALLVACSTTQSNISSNMKKDVLQTTNLLKNFEMTTNLNINMQSGSNSATAKIKVAGTDSVALSLFGPFGISVGKVYADENQLIFLNLLTNQIIKGKPSLENMKTAVMLPMSYSDFIRLIRCETPGKTEEFSFDRELNDSSDLYKNSTNADFVEYALMSKRNKEMTQYQRKANDGTMIIHVFYSDYKVFDNVSYSTKQIYKFPSMNADLSLEVTNFKQVEKFDTPFLIKIPKGMDVIDLEQR